MHLTRVGRGTRMIPALLALTLLAQEAPPEGPLAHVRQTAYARLETAKAIAADREILRAVLAKNGARETMEVIRRKDAQWVANRNFLLRRELTDNACARRLRKLTSADAFIVEALVMDHQGALVCATVETSDYWQGDEAKWQKTYAEGGASFVDQPALDESTGTYAIQLSVLMKEGERKVGALTLTLKLRLPSAGSP